MESLNFLVYKKINSTVPRKNKLKLFFYGFFCCFNNTLFHIYISGELIIFFSLKLYPTVNWGYTRKLILSSILIFIIISIFSNFELKI